MVNRLYHLTERQREILAEVQLDADIPIADVAKRVRLPEFAVRRTLTLLRDQGIVDKLWYLNPFANGYGLYDILLELTPAFIPKMEKLLLFLVRSPEVEFITELSGIFSLSFTLRCRTPQEATDFLGRLSTVCPNSISAKDISTFLSLTDVPIFRSSRQSRRRAYLSFVSSESALELDSLDERILTQMRSSPDASLSRIARTLGIPATTAAYRVNTLKERGAIIGARYFVDMFRLGYSFAAHRIVLASQAPAHIEGMQSRLQALPGVYFTMRCLGRWDLVVGTVTQDSSALTKCTASIASLLGSHALRIDTTPIISFHKLNGSAYPSALVRGRN